MTTSFIFKSECNIIVLHYLNCQSHIYLSCPEFESLFYFGDYTRSSFHPQNVTVLSLMRFCRSYVDRVSVLTYHLLMLINYRILRVKLAPYHEPHNLYAWDILGRN